MWKRIREHVRRNAFVYNIVTLGVILFLLMILSELVLLRLRQYGLLSDSIGFWVNIVTEGFGIVVTVVIIEQFNRRARRKETIERLIREMRSRNAHEGSRAVDEARERGFLEDGSLRGCVLELANLQEAFLMEADLQAANLLVANLRGARLRGTNLEDAKLGAANLQLADLRDVNLCGANLRWACLVGVRMSDVRFDTKTVLPDATYLDDDDNGNPIYDRYWTPETDMERYVDQTHPFFWQPEWAAAGYENWMEWDAAGSPTPKDQPEFIVSGSAFTH